MVLITGGAYSGMEEFALQLYVKQNNTKKMHTVFIHKIIEDFYDKGEPLTKFLQNWILKNEIEGVELLLIHEEVGCGLIPDSKEKRENREIQGRAGCFFAEKADEVYRVCCGLGLKIK